MRYRKKKNYNARLALCRHLLIDPENGALQLKQFMDCGRRIELEIGSGKGNFITELAKLNPSNRYIAVEKVDVCNLLAMEKALSKQCDNLKFLLVDAKTLKELVPARSVDTIYLNFSDPWPKKSHYKRRLTSQQMLMYYLDLLKDSAPIQFKTDNLDFFEFTIDEFRRLAFEISRISYDLHADRPSDAPQIMTEYERKFSEKGMKINWLKAIPTDNTYQILNTALKSAPHLSLENINKFTR